MKLTIISLASTRGEQFQAHNPNCQDISKTLKHSGGRKESTPEGISIRDCIAKYLVATELDGQGFGMEDVRVLPCCERV